jgi:hypothetical protein
LRLARYYTPANQATGSPLPFRWQQPEGLSAHRANGAKVAEINGQDAIGSDPFSDCHHGGIG